MNNTNLENNKSDLIILLTDREDKEILAHKIAKQVYKEFPYKFKGNELCLCYKLKYTPPYETFDGLKNLILNIKDITGLRKYFKGFVCINVEEWIGHENEDFFIIFLKYLHDHRQHQQYIFTVGTNKIKNIRNLVIQSMKYLSLKIENVVDEDNKIKIEELIIKEFNKQNKSINIESAKFIANLTTNLDLRNPEILKSIVNDITAYCKNKTINKNLLNKYACDDSTILNLLTENSTYIERKIR